MDRIAFLAAGETAHRRVGDPPGAQRMSRARFRQIVVQPTGAAAFLMLPRLYACYRGTSSSRGLLPGAGPGFGAEFVFIGPLGDMTVVVVDPRTKHTANVSLAAFLARGIDYWLNFPRGWATSRALLPMPADCQRAMKSYVDCRTQQARRTCKAALDRYFGIGSGAPADAECSPAALFALCADVAGVSWRLDAGSRCSADLFGALETRHCRRLLAWDQGLQPHGVIVQGRLECDAGRALVAVKREIVGAFLVWIEALTADTIVRAFPAYKAELEKAARAQKRKRVLAGTPPACVTACLMPRQGAYAKVDVRWRIGAVIAQMCADLDVEVDQLVDLAAAKRQWRWVRGKNRTS